MERSVENAGREIATLLDRAQRRIARATDRALSVAGTSAAQRPVLETLWQRGECSPAELAKAVGVEGPPMSRMLKRMEAAGLVRRRNDPRDRRRQLIAPTPKAERLREYLPGLADAVLSAALATLPPATIDRLRSDLTALLSALEPLAHRP